MDCIEFGKKIDDYMRDQLSDEELNDFLCHLKGCRKCNEELEINYIVSEGVKRLDKNKSDYNLSGAYAEAKEASCLHIRHRKSMMRLSYVIDTIALWMLAITAFIYLRMLILG